VRHQRALARQPLRSFATVPEEDSASNAKETKVEKKKSPNFDKRRKALLLERRKLHKRLQREAVQQQAKVDALEGLQFRTEKEFQVLFNQIAPTVTITKLRGVVRSAPS
jgi:hypothetical protein